MFRRSGFFPAMTLDRVIDGKWLKSQQELNKIYVFNDGFIMA